MKHLFFLLLAFMGWGSSMAYGQTTITQDFATEPGDWTEVASRTTPSNFGYSATTNISATAGEAGGIIVRRSDPITYYAMELPQPITSLDQPFSFSFKYKMLGPVNGANVHLGFFNPTTLGGGQPPYVYADNYPNVLIANLDDGVDLFGVLSYNAEPGDYWLRFNTPRDGALGDHLTHLINVSYDPAAGVVDPEHPDSGAQGRINFLLDGNPRNYIDLNYNARTHTYNFTHFGVFASPNENATGTLQFYIDDVSITYTPVEPPAETKGWVVYE